MKNILLEDDNFCCVCGKKNKLGFKLNFLVKGEKIFCEFLPQKEHQGFKDIVHGGIIGLLLDEAMVNLLWKLGKEAVTAHFGMRLKKPAKVNERLFFEAGIKKEEKKIVHTYSICRNKTGQVIALGWAKCVKV